jgi:two-component system, OmpR family, sensor histidine kinase TctE
MTRALSLRRQLLLGILLPVMAVVLLNAFTLYRQALASADTAYDRTLLASAKAIGELLRVEGTATGPRLVADLPYSALEAFEADNRSRIYYRVAGFGGESVSGFDDLPPPRRSAAGDAPEVYAALVRFYDEAYRGEPVRMAVLLQPVSGAAGQGMATIQVAETLELRHSLARRLLLQTLWQQGLLLALVAGVVLWVVQRATRPVRQLSRTLVERPEADLSPLPSEGAPRELQPVIDATNAVMARLAHLLAHQKRFVRDASHQLRTPLAVLKAQVQSARRGDVEPMQALAEIDHTVQGATELANQMLALAKVEQLRQQGREAGAAPEDWAPIVQAVALDLAPLVAAGRIEFELQVMPAPVAAHAWSLRELTRNLVHNAIKHTPAGGTLQLQLRTQAGQAVLVVQDSGPGLAAAQAERLFQPFAAAGPAAGSGLGLAICREIVATAGGQIVLRNREGEPGLRAEVQMPIATNP